MESHWHELQTAAADGGQALDASPHALWLCFDARGAISYCSLALARLLGRDHDDLTGVHITSVMPEYPVRGDTPGYNVAVMRMKYVNCPHALALALAEGRRIYVQAVVRSVRLSRGPAFVVNIHRVGSA